MRLTPLLLVAVAALMLAGCSSDDESAAPPPTAQRFVSEAEAPGSKPDDVEKRETTTDYAIFIPALSEHSIDPDRDEMMAVFDADEFKSAGTDARFWGETHSREANHVFSSFVELGSEDGATNALEWLEADQLKPCPMSCAVQRTAFEVDDIPDARGVHRVATAEDIERVGTPDERPQDDYWIGFTVGPVAYTVTLQGRPGSGVSEDQARQIAATFYERLTGE